MKSNQTSKLSPRKKPTQLRATFTVNAILDAAAYLLKNRGYERLTTNAVAELAGFSVGTLYQYFSNRESLIAELRHRHHQEVHEAMQRAAELNEGVNFEMSVKNIVAANVRVHAADPELHYLLSERYANIAFELNKNEPRFYMVKPKHNLIEKLLLRDGALSSHHAGTKGQVCTDIVISLTHAANKSGMSQFTETVLVDEIVCAVMGYLGRAGATFDDEKTKGAVDNCATV